MNPYLLILYGKGGTTGAMTVVMIEAMTGGMTEIMTAAEAAVAVDTGKKYSLIV